MGTYASYTDEQLKEEILAFFNACSDSKVMMFQYGINNITKGFMRLKIEISSRDNEQLKTLSDGAFENFQRRIPYCIAHPNFKVN